jgi:hypothetical protein
MTHPTSEIDRFALPLPITQAARDRADRFASRQPTSTKAEQVRLNMLAVWVVNSYLELMGVATDWEQSDSQNAFMSLFEDVADLAIPGVGSLECRPVSTGAGVCRMPPEVWEGRVGYVVVQIEEPPETGKILGFTPTVTGEELPLSQLRSPEELLDHLYALRSTSAPEVTPALQVPVRTHLSQWFADLIETGWYTLEWLLNQPELAPAYAFRNREAIVSQLPEAGIRRLKLLHLGGEVGERSVILMVQVSELTPPSDRPAQYTVKLQLHPISQRHLPPGVRFEVLDQSGISVVDAVSREQDNYLQLQINGTAGESFDVQISLGEVQLTQAFVI